MAAEATITLSVSEYEGSILTGALDEFRARWCGDDGDSADSATAERLRERVLKQMPDDWKDEVGKA